MDSNKRIVKFDSNIREAGIFEGWLVCHVHHVKVVLTGPVSVHRFISVNVVQSSDSSDVESRPVELGKVQSQQLSLELLHCCKVDGVRYELAKRIVREIVQINIHSGASSAGSSLRVQVAHRLPLDIVHEFDELDELEDLVSEKLEIVPVGVGVSTDFGEGAAEISSHDRGDVGLSSATVHERESADVRERALVVLVVHRPEVAVRIVPADNVSRLDNNGVRKRISNLFASFSVLLQDLGVLAIFLVSSVERDEVNESSSVALSCHQLGKSLGPVDVRLAASVVFQLSSSADDVVDNVGMFNRLHDLSIASVSDVEVLVKLKSAEIAH